MNLRKLNFNVNDSSNYAIIEYGYCCATYHRDISFKFKDEYPFNTYTDMHKSIVNNRDLTSEQIDEQLRKTTKVKFIKNVDELFCLIYIIKKKKYSIIAIDIFNERRI